MLDLSLAEARIIAVGTQGLHCGNFGDRSARDVLNQLGCIQLDTISVVRRSHELVQLARGVNAAAAASAIDEIRPAMLFEYWAHAASLVPLRLWPLFGFRRRRYLTKGWSGPSVDPDACEYVRSVLADRGRATISELGGARGDGWNRESANKWALEWLLAIGEVACVSRRGWQRVYQPVENVIPAELLHADPDDQACLSALVVLAIDALGVATTDDIADYFRLPSQAVAQALAQLPEAMPARVESWPMPAWVASSALTPAPIDEAASTPLSPFDSLIWHRPRMRRLFGVEYLLEAYKPAAKRECGYFGMPVLTGSSIVGRIAIRVNKGQAVLEGWHAVDNDQPNELLNALETACRWAGAHNVPPFPDRNASVGVVS
ncbi:winged helix-turn-helix domain-containing protein [Nocardia gipuzkoensis]